MPKPDPRVSRAVRKTYGRALPNRLPPPTSTGNKIERWRRLLGLQYPRRQFTILRHPVRVVLYLSRRPSLSIRKNGMTLNISRKGLRPTLRALGFSRQLKLFSWSRLKDLTAPKQGRGRS